MSFTTAFENYLVLEDAAKECTEQLEVKFQEFSKALQKDILPSRPSAEEKFLKLLTNYKRQECHKMDKLLGSSNAGRFQGKTSMTMLSKALITIKQ